MQQILALNSLQEAVDHSVGDYHLEVPVGIVNEFVISG
jgi:hypothetical protein